MSFDVNWQNLISDNVINESIQEFLDSQFRSIQLPSYINNLSVSHFSLGEKAPEITIRHIGDPFDEFYQDSLDDEQQDEDRKDDDQEDQEDGETSATESTSRFPHAKVQPEPSFGFQVDELDARLDAMRKAIPPSRPDSPALVKSDAFRASLDSISLIMGSNNLLYSQPQTMNNLVGLGPLSSHIPTNNCIDWSSQDTGSQLPHSPSPLRISTSVQATSKHENDVQLVLEINYSGDLTIDISVNLLVNYPSPNFISLPIKLHITGVVIHAVAVVAYLQRQVFFSFLCDIDDVNADYFTHSAASFGNNLHHTPSGGNFVDILSGPSSRQRIDIIKRIHIESEIGEFENNILRNVGKVEKFLIDQLRGIIRDEVAWPSWICIDLNDDSDSDEDGV